MDASPKQRAKQSSGPKKEPAPADARAAALEGEDAVEDEEIVDDNWSCAASVRVRQREESTIRYAQNSHGIGRRRTTSSRELTGEDVDARERAPRRNEVSPGREIIARATSAKATAASPRSSNSSRRRCIADACRARSSRCRTERRAAQSDYGRTSHMRKIIPYIAAPRLGTGKSASAEIATVVSPASSRPRFASMALNHLGVAARVAEARDAGACPITPGPSGPPAREHALNPRRIYARIRIEALEDEQEGRRRS